MMLKLIVNVLTLRTSTDISELFYIDCIHRFPLLYYYLMIYSIFFIMAFLFTNL